MRSFDVRVVSVHKRSHVPHWHTWRGIHGITFNLFDAVPAERLARIRNEVEALERGKNARFGTLTPADLKSLRRCRVARTQNALDEGHGLAFMRDPAVAKVVADALQHFDGLRYELYAWCVMPNHVHVVAAALDGVAIAQIVHTWKSFTSKMANRALRRAGAFWQEDYFDRAIRSDVHLSRAVDYVAGNPARAGLEGWPWAKIYPERIAKG